MVEVEACIFGEKGDYLSILHLFMTICNLEEITFSFFRAHFAGKLHGRGRLVPSAKKADLITDPIWRPARVLLFFVQMHVDKP